MELGRLHQAHHDARALAGQFTASGVLKTPQDVLARHLLVRASVTVPEKSQWTLNSELS